MNGLTMLSGDINTGSNTLVLGTSALNAGALNYTAGRITGKFSRWFAAGTNSGNTGLFPLGINNQDRFVTVEYGTALLQE